MPWKKFSMLEERARFVLAVKSEGESFGSVCGGFWISRKTGYKWWQRYQAAGVKALADASRRPRHRGRMHRWGAKKLRRLLR